MPIRIQRKRTKGWKMPPNTVYVGRGSRWGNPYSGKDAIKMYKEWLKRWKRENPKLWKEALGKLRGKNLACWCPLDKPCHADVLLELANEGGKQ